MLSLPLKNTSGTLAPNKNADALRSLYLSGMLLNYPSTDLLPTAALSMGISVGFYNLFSGSSRRHPFSLKGDIDLC